MNPKNQIPRLFVVTFIALLSATICAGQASRAFIERHVMRSLRQIQSAQATYSATTGAGSYGSLADLLQAGFIDEALATGDKYGYVFVITTATGPPRFNVTATPRVYRKTGTRSFYIDSRDIEIRGGDLNGQPATSTHPIIDDCTSGAIVENERCTIQDMTSLIGAQTTYQATVGNQNYGTFEQLYAAGLIRAGLRSGSSRGYFFEYLIIDYVPGTQQPSFKIWATPHTYGITGIRSFYTDQTGVLRGADRNGARADHNDPPIDW